MQWIKQNEATAAKKKVAFTTVEPDNWENRVDASALSFTVYVVKADGTVAAGGGNTGIGASGVTQPDAVHAKGVCFYEPGGTDLDTVGPVVFVISAGSSMEIREIPALVVPADLYDGAALGLTRLDGAVTSRASQTSADSSLADLKAGAGHENSVIDNITYGSENMIVVARERVFASAAAANAAVAGHADGADGEIRRYTISAVDAGSGQFSSWKKTRTL